MTMRADCSCVNVGGYDPAQFTELHKIFLLAVADARTAKAKAKARIQDWLQPHKDRLFEVERPWISRP